ncbi:uncharacterized protein HMPREF1541_08985 [Cyphellophora europaea CBS 101466]|uniref:SCP domain-containing protein n=1 Tax=Cyphellophora europaea (strain CBS 101466) TaxID=1220924 RepID=W2RJN4_CYPE1|nr:uncharacterized protein HMPREF1541_08985 [Cyphellophora europaea CBS 101466]ETN36707.1 hypothetical protein HMPREF1541_08985 [Cyphellophora europaea CBS 101466]
MKFAIFLIISSAIIGVLTNSFNERAIKTDMVAENVYTTVFTTLFAEPTAARHDRQAAHSAVATSSKPSESASSDSSYIPSDYAKNMIDAHNSHRRNHSATALTWSDELADIAQKIGESCVYAHDTKTGGGGYGQNIGAGIIPSRGAAMITNYMYNGEFDLYPGYGSEPNMELFEKWGHFSQIVWKNTSQVGCATVHCPGGLANTGNNISPHFTVCNYRPAGNLADLYTDNVLQPNGEDMITL